MTDAQRPAPADLDAILERVDNQYEDVLAAEKRRSTRAGAPHELTLFAVEERRMLDAEALVAEVRALQQELQAAKPVDLVAGDQFVIPIPKVTVHAFTAREEGEPPVTLDDSTASFASMPIDGVAGLCVLPLIDDGDTRPAVEEHWLDTPLGQQIMADMTAATPGNTDNLTAARFTHPFPLPEEGTATC